MLQTSANIAGNAIKLRHFETFAEAEEHWRAFQGRAVTTPYQQFDWLEPWFRHVGSERGVRPVLVCGEAYGAPAFLWPLGIERVRGVRVCSWLGGKQCNYNLGLYDPEILAGFDSETVRTFLNGISDLAGGVDVFELLNQPLAWNGFDNPFAGLAATASPSPCYRLTLQSDYKALEKARRSPRSVQTLRRKARKLGESHGAPQLRLATLPDEIEDVFATFMLQRGDRFGSMGVANVFAEGAMAAFLREVSQPRSAGDCPVLSFHALSAGGDICATYCGLTFNGHYSCFANSIDDDRFGKFSPGEILLAELIEDCCTSGLGGFDLGMGTERYKLSWCDEDRLFDCLVPVTMRGRLYRLSRQAALSLKRAIRSNPRAWAMAKALRRHLHAK